MKISFFPVPEHRVFHYEPRYYDPKKEEMKKRYEKYGKDYDKANEPYSVGDPNTAEKQEERKYVPGQLIRESYRAEHTTRRRSSGNTPIRKLVIVIGVIAAILVAYYLAQGLGVFFSAI